MSDDLPPSSSPSLSSPEPSPEPPPALLPPLRSSTTARSGLMQELWLHPWGRVFMIAITIATVSWALRETAIVTLPVIAAIGEVVLPLAIGFTIAYILNPIVDQLQRPLRSRLVAASALYLVLGVVSVVAVALVVPSVARQSTELVSRTFQDQPYLDLTGDGNYNEIEQEPLLTVLADQPGVFFHDHDGDGIPSKGESQYRMGHHPVRVTPSLAGVVLAWMEDQQVQVDRLMGLQLDNSRSAFLVTYQESTDPVRAVLDRGLAIAREGLPRTVWPTELMIDPEVLPAMTMNWDGSWPGATGDELASALAGLAPADGERLSAVLQWHGRLYMTAHQTLVSGWDRLRGASNAAAMPTLAPLAPDVSLPPSIKNLYTAVVDLQAMDLVTELSGEIESESLAIGDLISKLEQGERAESTYATSLMRRLRSDSDSGGGAVLQNFIDRIGGGLRGGVEEASQSAGTYVTTVVTNIGGVLSFALDVVLVPIYAFFLTLVMPGIRRQVRRYLPTRMRVRAVRILHDIERVVSAFFRGRLIVCLLCALLMWIGLALIGVPYAALFGICIGLATAVPLSGLLFLIPMCLLVMIEGGDGVVWQLTAVVSVYLVVQTLEMTVFTPTIMGREVELHPVTLIIALVLCGKLLGILGLILAVPIAATLRILAREFVLHRLREVADVPATTMFRRTDLEMSGMHQVADAPTPTND